MVAAVAPARLETAPGWLVPLDDGAIGRAKSAVPLRHDVGPSDLARIERLYREAGLPAGFRIAESAGLTTVRSELSRMGYAPHKPTVMMTGSAQGLARLTEPSAEVLKTPDPAWAACFAGEGFDPEEGAARVRNLARSPDALYGAVREGERVAAVGVMSFGEGWAGIHGMRTAPDHRRQGLASRVLASLGRAAVRRGYERVYLQVEAENPAQDLFLAAGFTEAWRYRYWTA